MLLGHKSRSNDFVCTPQPVSQITALQSHRILLFYSVITCVILTNCVLRTSYCRPSSQRLSSGRAFPARPPSLGIRRRARLLLQQHLACRLDDSFPHHRPRHSFPQSFPGHSANQFTLSHSLLHQTLNTTPLVHDMKIKKLVAALTVTLFGIAAALTAPSSVPPYANVSINDTAAIDPYVYSSCSVLAFFCFAYMLSSFPHSAKTCDEGNTTQHGQGLCGTLPRVRTPSTTPYHPTPHSAEYQAFAVIKLH